MVKDWAPILNVVDVVDVVVIVMVMVVEDLEKDAEQGKGII